MMMIMRNWTGGDDGDDDDDDDDGGDNWGPRYFGVR